MPRKKARTDGPAPAPHPAAEPNPARESPVGARLRIPGYWWEDTPSDRRYHAATVVSRHDGTGASAGGKEGGTGGSDPHGRHFVVRCHTDGHEYRMRGDAVERYRVPETGTPGGAAGADGGGEEGAAVRPRRRRRKSARAAEDPAGPVPSVEGVGSSAPDGSALLPGRYYDGGIEVEPQKDDVVLLASSSDTYRELMCSRFKSLKKRPTVDDLRSAAAGTARALAAAAERVFAPVVRGESGSGSGDGGVCFVRVVDDGGIVARECKCGESLTGHFRFCEKERVLKVF